MLIKNNMGTKSKFDMKNPAAAEQIWYQFLVEIKAMDNDFYQAISTKKEMVSKKIYNKRRFREQQAVTV